MDVKSYHIKHYSDNNSMHYSMNVDISIRGNHFEETIKKILTDFEGVSIDDIE